MTDLSADSKKSDDEKTSNHDSSAVSKLQIGNGLVQISAGMVEILLDSRTERQNSNELQIVWRLLEREECYAFMRAMDDHGVPVIGYSVEDLKKDVTTLESL